MITLLKSLMAGCFLPVLNLLLTGSRRAAVGVKIAPEKVVLKLYNTELFKSQRSYIGCTFRYLRLHTSPCIRGVVFYDCEFRDCSIENTMFEDCKFINCKFTYSEFSGVTFDECVFVNITTRSAKFRECRFDGVEFTNWNNTFLGFMDSRLDKCEFSSFDVRGVSLFSESLITSCKGLHYAQVTFDRMGEQGRTLTMLCKDDLKLFFCGCFSGTERRLRGYIENRASEEKLTKTRLLALDSLLNIVNQTNTIYNEETNTTTKEEASQSPA